MTPARYFTKHNGFFSEVLQVIEGQPIGPIAIFIATSTSSTRPWAHEGRANEYSNWLNGLMPSGAQPPTEEYIRDHSYDHRDIHRAAITSRNETIDELRNCILRIARTAGMEGGWGLDFEHLVSRIEGLAAYEKQETKHANR